MSLTHPRDITCRDAIEAAVQAAQDAGHVLANTKTPIGARAIGLPTLAQAWADIAAAMAMDVRAWTLAGHELAGAERKE